MKEKMSTTDTGQEIISQEKLAELKNIQTKLEIARKDVQIYELGYRAVLLELFVEYKLSKNDSFNFETGIISRAQITEVDRVVE